MRPIRRSMRRWYLITSSSKAFWSPATVRSTSIRSVSAEVGAAAGGVLVMFSLRDWLAPRGQRVRIWRANIPHGADHPSAPERRPLQPEPARSRPSAGPAQPAAALAGRGRLRHAGFRRRPRADQLQPCAVPRQQAAGADAARPRAASSPASASSAAAPPPAASRGAAACSAPRRPCQRAPATTAPTAATRGKARTPHRITHRWGAVHAVGCQETELGAAARNALEDQGAVGAAEAEVVLHAPRRSSGRAPRWRSSPGRTPDPG